MSKSESYEVTRLNRVGRLPARARYDTETVHAIFQACPTVHLAFVDEQGLPQCVPLVAALDEGPDGLFVILHGYHKARFVRLATEKGVPLCVTATFTDGIVLAMAAFHHSINYRSATLHGFSDPISEDDLPAKRRASELVVESVLKGRSLACRMPNDTELRSTGFVRMRIESGSAKIRTGGPKDDQADLEDVELLKRCWTGVIPLRSTWQTPCPASVNRAPLPGYVQDHVQGIL